MEARKGDRLVVESNRVGQARKVAEVLEVRGPTANRRTSSGGATATRA
ncbi:MAG TPA: DUF1918 domain-containing protein [Marmoricola sp.]|nr:DUF1918 domain-containing protein [Marmoricola sp.]